MSSSGLRLADDDDDDEYYMSFYLDNVATKFKAR